MEENKKQEGLKKLKENAWEAFSRLIRIRDGLKTTGNPWWALCFTCDIRKDYKHLEAGHFIAGRHNAVLFDEDCVNAQCHQCNGFKHGNPLIYRQRMVAKYGEKAVEQMEIDAKKTVKFTPFQLIKMRKDFTERANELLKATVKIKPDTYDYSIQQNYQKIRKFLWK